MWNFECSTFVIVTPFVLIMKDKVKELFNLGPRAFAIGAEDDEVFADDDSSVGEYFEVCCPGQTSNFLFLKS